MAIIYVTNQKHRADLKIYREKQKHRADMLIFVENQKHRAKKMRLFMVLYRTKT